MNGDIISWMLYLDRGIPQNTTGAVDRCKSSEELYYKLEQELPPHNLMAMRREPGVMAAIYFYTV